MKHILFTIMEKIVAPTLLVYSVGVLFILWWYGWTYEPFVYIAYAGIFGSLGVILLADQSKVPQKLYFKRLRASFYLTLTKENTMSKKYNVTISIPLDIELSDVSKEWEDVIEVEANSYDEAVQKAQEEFSDGWDADSIYDIVYDDIRMNASVYLDGDYEPNFEEESYFTAEEVQPKKTN